MDDDRVLKQFLATYDAPAFVRRARRVQEVFDSLIRRCRQQREEWLPPVRTRLGVLRALAGEWSQLRPWLAGDDPLATLRQLEDLLAPQPCLSVKPTASPRRLRAALGELTDALEAFNRRWQTYLQGLDLTPVNAARDGYNRYYLLEKECAVRSPRIARQGFCRLEPLTRDQLAELLPPLPVPRRKP